MLQGEGRFLLLGRMLVSESGDVPVAERKALGISQNERVFEATRAGAAIFLRHLVGQSATSNDLVGGWLGQQGGRRHRIIEPSLDADVAGDRKSTRLNSSH